MDEEGADDKDKDAQKGEARARQLQQRFDEWFYVISDMSFKQIHKDRSEMFKAPPADKTPAGDGPAPDKPESPDKKPEKKPEKPPAEGKTPPAP